LTDRGVSDWLKNDKLFFEQLEIGHSWANYVAQKICERDISCYATQMEKRKNANDRFRFRSEKDILFNNMPGYLDVKANSYNFGDDPQTFPYKSPFVDTAHGWSKKPEKPLAVLLVSQQTGSIIVIPVSTEKMWVPIKKFDRIRKIEDTFLTIDKSLIKTFDEFIEWLTARQMKFSV
jgi:hypothetical protein